MRARPFIHVAVAAIVNSSGEVLVSQRRQGTHLGGYWEFPGGKLKPDESIPAALRRELKEELDIVPQSCRPLIRVRHQYAEKSVLLDVWKIESYGGDPRGVEGQAIEWRAVKALDKAAFPPADVPIINALALPCRCLITGTFSSAADFAQRLTRALQGGIKLVQLRLTHDWLAANNRAYADEIIERAATLCDRFWARLVVNRPDGLSLPANAGIHLNSRQLLEVRARPARDLVSASCHNRRELEHAQSIGVDFALLSPVKETASHPLARPLGWDAFYTLADPINIPVYALGGVNEDDLARAWRAGAQGVAAISAWWRPSD